MWRCAVIVALARAFLGLSPQGKRFLWSLRGMRRSGASAEARQVLRDPRRRQGLLRTLRVCDRCFIRLVPESICRRTGRSLEDVYRRFVPFAWCGVEIRCRTLDAFAVPYDEAALERLLVACFLHREFNDRQETHAAQEIYGVIRLQVPPPADCLLLHHLAREFDALIPRARFPIVYEMLPHIPKLSEDDRTAAQTREQLAAKSNMASLAILGAMKEELPEPLREALKPFSLWFYALDQLADVDEDKAEGRLTFIGTVADPVAEIWRLLADAEQALRRLARDPERLLTFMHFLTRKVVDARRTGQDFEKSFLQIAP